MKENEKKVPCPECDALLIVAKGNLVGTRVIRCVPCDSEWWLDTDGNWQKTKLCLTDDTAKPAEVAPNQGQDSIGNTVDCPNCKACLPISITSDGRKFIECPECKDQCWFWENGHWHQEATKTRGTKFDTGKLRWATLMPWKALTETMKVLEHGAQKYGPNNWQIVPGARARYLDALGRHFIDYACGEKLDRYSKINHMAHIMCNALFLLSFDIGECPEPPEEDEADD